MSDASHAKADHQDTSISEKLKLLKICSLKTEQKQAVVGVLIQTLILWFCSGCLGGLGFLQLLEILIYNSALLSLADIG